MTDLLDQAQEREDREREAAIAAQRKRHAVLPDIGECYFCRTPTAAGRRFCDAECRDDYDLENHLKNMAGKPGKC